MDLVDLFAGSEGTLGILLSLNLRVIPIPPACWSLIFFFSDEKEALAFAGKLKTLPAGAGEILCAEFFDPLSLSLFREAQEEQTSLAPLPDPPSGATCAILLLSLIHISMCIRDSYSIDRRIFGKGNAGLIRLDLTLSWKPQGRIDWNPCLGKPRL